MEATSITLMLLLAVVVSSMIERASPLPLPLPFVQIALGGILAAVFDLRIVIEPEFFLLLFIAPLLFLDSWRMSKSALRRDRWTVGALAFGLVLFTVAGAGLFIHWLIPAIPAAIAFALAAVLAPTDAVALSAIAARAPIPTRLMHVLEGESLLNDATGLVCLRFAVAAALTGTFSPVDAGLTFLWLAIGGGVIGAAVAAGANWTKDAVAARYGEQTGSQILISLLIPFGAYVAADRLGASGILAAVAAGLVMSREEASGRAGAGTRLRRAAVWDAIQFAGNGVIFVLLGQQMAGLLAGAGEAIGGTGHSGLVWLLVYGLAIFAGLAALRAFWAFVTLRLILYRAARRAAGPSSPGWRLVAVTTFAGVRGALTLSGIMTLPYALEGGIAFPTRDLVILLAASVILLSLLAANATLPWLSRGLSMPEAGHAPDREAAARVAAAEAAVRAVEQALERLPPEGAEPGRSAGARLIARYRDRVDGWRRDHPDAARKAEGIEHALMKIALGAEREALRVSARSGGLAEDTVRTILREIDLEEQRIGEG